MSAGVVLQAREYKILLKADAFVGKPKDVAGRFWEDRLKPLIARALGPRRSGEPRHKNKFDRNETRIVGFRDAAGHLLTRNGYILRERARLSDDRKAVASRDVTLKFRKPDLFLVAASVPTDVENGVKVKFEEDIAPFQLQTVDGLGVKSVIVAEPRSMWSRFALSVTRSVGDAPLKRMKDATRLHPSLRVGLEKVGGPIDPDMELLRGPEIDERVFEGAEAEFGGGVEGAFALTLWRFDGAAETQAPDVVEISYKCRLQDGRLPADAARRASDLFIAMQEDLGRWINMRDASKTALGLPRRTV